MVEFLTNNASMIVTVVGAVLSGIATVSVTAIRWAWKTLETRNQQVSDDLEEFIKTSRNDSKKVVSAIHTLKAESALIQKQIEFVREATLRLEAGQKQTQDSLYQQVKDVSKMDSKLEALFRFVDAPKRTTDVRR